MARVTSPDGDSLWFRILAGIMQGDTLAPYLFIIVLDYALIKALEGKEDLGFTLAPRRSCRHPAKTITDLDYADDLATLCDTIQDAQKLMYQLETAAAEVDLHINAKKTQCINFNQPSGGILTAFNFLSSRRWMTINILKHGSARPRKISQQGELEHGT